MSGLIEVIEPGLAVTVQDRGRSGFRALGVPVSGALDPCLMDISNALLGNPDDAAVLELRLAGPTLKAVAGPVRISLAGEIEAQLLPRDGAPRAVAPWQTATLMPGDAIRIGAPKAGTACVGGSGGFEVPMQLRSRSTYLRAALGGVAGRALARGDRIGCGAFGGDPWVEREGAGAWTYEDGPLRVILGPQDDHFTREALAAFLAQPYTATRDMDRMGIRLEGPALAHGALGADIVSDGVAPGAIQVPGNGQPIILLADAQTVGGYPKIATVIRADLPRLAHLRPGEALRFRAVDAAEARQALAAQCDRLLRWQVGIRAFLPAGTLDRAALQQANLISGQLRGDEPELALLD